MISGWRLAGILTFLSAQAALAFFLGFIANLQRDEVGRYQRHLQFYPNSAYAEAAARRLYLETGGVIADAVAAVGLAGVVLVSTAKLSAPSFIRTVHRYCAWICFGFAALFLSAAIMTPRVGSAHNDMFPGLPAYASMAFAVLAGLASVVIAKLAKGEPRP
jgi:hypothetical protein